MDGREQGRFRGEIHNRGREQGRNRGRMSERQAPAEQMSLFPSSKRVSVSSERSSGTSAVSDSGISVPAPQLPGRRVLVNPHLVAARRLAKKMRQLPNHSSEETRVGLAICQQLRAFLREGSKPVTRH